MFINDRDIMYTHPDDVSAQKIIPFLLHNCWDNLPLRQQAPSSPTLNMLSLTFSYGHERNNFSEWFWFVCKEQHVLCKIAGAQRLRFQRTERSNSLRCLPVCLERSFCFTYFFLVYLVSLFCFVWSKVYSFSLYVVKVYVFRNSFFWFETEYWL